MQIRDAIVVLSVLCACSSTGTFVWVQDLPASAAASTEYLVATGDLISIRVLNQDGLATHSHVRADGRVAMPLVGDIEVRGKRPSALRAELEARLKEFIVAPSVTVNVDEFAPMQMSVLGEVLKPGVFPIDARGASVAAALASAGGLTDYADRSRIFVLRHGDKPVRVRFTYEAISRGDQAVARFSLAPGDIVVVE